MTMTNNFLVSAKDLRTPDVKQVTQSMFKLSKPTSPSYKSRNQLGGFLTPNDYAREVKTPEAGSRKGSVDRAGSVNFREMQGKLTQIRERMKSQGGSRFRGKMFNDTHVQGGFQAGFVNSGKGVTGVKAILSQRGFGETSTMAETQNEYKMNRSSTSCKVTINEMLESNMKSYFNKMRPKFGMKNYEIKDNMHKEPYFKIDKIAVNKTDKKDGVFDQYVKLKSGVPPAKYDMIQDWTKNFDKRGKFLKAQKISFVDSIMIDGKKRPKPAPGLYKHKEYIGKNISTNKKSSGTSEKMCGFIE